LLIFFADLLALWGMNENRCSTKAYIKFQLKALAQSLGIVYILLLQALQGHKVLQSEGHAESIRRWLQCSQGEIVCVNADAVLRIDVRAGLDGMRGPLVASYVKPA
jgi:hypothetical protein